MKFVTKYRAALLALIAISSCFPVCAQDVTTYHYDNWRTGWNDKEVHLTPQAVKAGSFGFLYSVDLDEQVDGQPLIVNNLLVDGKSRNLVFLVTENNTVYSIDTETGIEISHHHLEGAVPTPCGNSSDVVGINSTPVIDTASNTIYVIAYTLDDNKPSYHVHALDLITLNDKVTPVPTIKPSNSIGEGDAYNFMPAISRQRAALLLSNGKLYAAFGSFCDHNHDLSRGWVIGWQASSLKPLTKNQLLDHRRFIFKSWRLSSIWMSGYGISADAAGELFFVTGNSQPTPQDPPAEIGPNTFLADSVVKLSPELELHDWFTPSDPKFGQKTLDLQDLDFGSGGVMLIPDGQPNLSMHLAVAAGKVGQMYLLDRENLGKYDPAGVNHFLGAYDIGSCFCGPSYFVGSDGFGHVVSSGDKNLIVWRVAPSANSIKLVKDYESSTYLSTSFFQRGFFTSVSSNGEIPNTGIIWAVQRPAPESPAQNVNQLTLHAFDAKDGTLLCSTYAGPWPMTSRMAAAANTVPVVANGQVFVASYKRLRVYGGGGTPACGKLIAEASEGVGLASSELGEFVAPAEGRHGTVRGIVSEANDSRLLLRSGDKTIEVDLTEALQNGKVGNLSPGKPVIVKGIGQPGGSVKADTVFSGGVPQ